MYTVGFLSPVQTKLTWRLRSAGLASFRREAFPAAPSVNAVPSLQDSSTFYSRHRKLSAASSRTEAVSMTPGGTTRMRCVPSDILRLLHTFLIPPRIVPTVRSLLALPVLDLCHANGRLPPRYRGSREAREPSYASRPRNRAPGARSGARPDRVQSGRRWRRGICPD